MKGLISHQVTSKTHKLNVQKISEKIEVSEIEDFNESSNIIKFECGNCSKNFQTLAGHKHHMYTNPECSTITQQINDDKFELDLINIWGKLLRKKLAYIVCNNCKEIIFGKFCSQCKKNPLLFNKSNDAHPEEIPEVMKNITFYLASAISQIHPVQPILDKKHTFKGRVIFLIISIIILLRLKKRLFYKDKIYDISFHSRIK